MAEVHLIGQIAGASDFPHFRLACQWALHTGPGWTLIEGITQGQTQVDSPAVGGVSNWCHPVDVHWATRGLQGWPKFHLQVLHLDSYGRLEPLGYGYCPVPSAPGTHEIDVPVWRPTGTREEELSRLFLGGGLALRAPDVIYHGADRFRLRTTSVGVVRLSLSLILKDFAKYGVEH